MIYKVSIRGFIRNIPGLCAAGFVLSGVNLSGRNLQTQLQKCRIVTDQTSLRTLCARSARSYITVCIK
ncbi:hypothetical protein FKM82_015331 [Ascaphus truei]